jgi:hypothetical protein
MLVYRGALQCENVANDPPQRDVRLSLLPAIIGLVGVLIGSFLTAGFAYLGTRNDREADERAAIRLVSTEIATDQIALRTMAFRGRLLRTDPQLATEVWMEKKSELARTLDETRWNEVSSFYYELTLWQPSFTVGRCFSSEDWSNIVGLIYQGNRARKVLDDSPLLPLPKRSDRHCSP